MAMFTFREVRTLAANPSPGVDVLEELDELLDVIAADFAEMWPNAPEGVAFQYAAGQVALALKFGPPLPDDDSDGGGHGPRKPAPQPAPEMSLA